MAPFILRLYLKHIIFICIIFLISIAYSYSQLSDDFINEYNLLMQTNPTNAFAHRNLIAKWMNNSNLLIPVYENLANNSPNNPVFQYALGFTYAITENDEYVDKAIESFKKALDLDPNFMLAHFSLGSMYLRKNDYRQAEIELQKTIDLDNKFLAAYFNLGEVYRKQKQYDLALSAYKKAFEINKDWGWSYYGIGLVYFEQNNIDDAQLALKQATNNSPEIADAHFKLGQIYAMQDMDIETISKTYREGQKVVSKTKEEQQAFYDLGKIFASKGKSGLAIQAYKNAINIDPNMALAQYELGTQYYNMGLKERAIEHFQMAIKSDPSLRTLFVEEAKKYYEMGNRQEAMNSLEKSLTIDPQNAEAHYFYATLLSDNKSEAIKHYEDAIKIDPNFVKAYIPLGDLYYSDSRYDDARSAYKKAISIDKNNENYFFELGNKALQTKDEKNLIENLNNAKTNFEKHLMLYPNDSLANFKLGFTYEKLGEKDKALEYYQRSFDNDPSRYDILFNIARLSKEIGKLNESLDMLNKVTDNTDEQNIKIKAYKIKAEILDILGEKEKAISALEEVVKLDTNDAESHYKLGLFYEEKQDHQRAIAEYSAVISTDQTKADPYLHLGNLYTKLGMDEMKIMEVYEKGLILDPNHPQIQYDLAVLYKKYKDYDKAIEHYQMANKLSPNNYLWQYEYAKLQEGKDNREALKAYTRAIELKRDFAECYYDRAMLLRKAKIIDGKVYRNEQIIEDLKQAGELNPKMADAFYNIALIYKENDSIELAREFFEKTIKADPNYPGIHVQLGLIAEQRGEYAKAMEEYKKEIAINNKSALAYQRLGFLYSNDKQDLQKADEAFLKSLALEPDNIETLIHYANNLYMMGKFGQSADQFEKVLQLDPKNPTANYNLALVYETWGKKKLAIEQWQKFLQLNPPGSWAEEARKRLKELGVK
ncbi:MAG: tetratricopeptide repeat protein [bacterium]